MKNKKIAVLIIPNLQGNGAEKFVLNMYQALETYQGYECHIICFGNIIEHDIDQNIRLHILELPKPKKLLDKLLNRKFESKYLEEYILNEIGQPAITLSNLTRSDKITKFFNIPNTFHVIHSTTSIEHLKTRSGLKRWIAIKKLESVYSRHECICVSQGVKEDLDSNFALKPNSYYIYNPVNQDEIMKLALQSIPQSSEGISLPDNYFIHIGKFNDAKRHDRLIRAYSKSLISEKLLLVGKGPKYKEMKELVKSLNLEGKVIFFGQTPNPYPLIKNAKGLILASDYEGLPTVILEALCLHTPAISTNCKNGPKELLPSNSLCELNEEAITSLIQSLSNHPESHMGEFNKQFTLEVAAKSYNKMARLQ